METENFSIVMFKKITWKVWELLSNLFMILRDNLIGKQFKYKNNKWQKSTIKIKDRNSMIAETIKEVNRDKIFGTNLNKVKLRLLKSL